MSTTKIDPELEAARYAAEHGIPYQPASGMAAFQDALGDYYDAGMIGDPPRREQFQPAARSTK